MRRRDKIIVAAIGLFCLLGSFVFFQFYYPYHLFYREQMLLFLYTPGYLSDYFNHPAWLSAMLGDYLTQYYYLIGGGAAILSVSLVLLGGLLWASIRKMLPDKPALVLSFLLFVYELSRNFGLNYELSSTLSLAGGAAMFLLHEWFIRKNNHCIWLAFLLLPFTYWLFGYGVWGYLLLLAVYSAWKTRQYWFLPAGLIAVLITVWLPRSHYLLTAKQAFLYPATELTAPMPNMNTEKLLALETEAYFENWPKVLKLAESSGMENSLITYYRNLAQSMVGSLPENLLDFYQPAALGLFQEVSPNNSIPGIRISNEVWFMLGDMTLAEHSAMLGMIFSPNHRSSRMLKRIAETDSGNKPHKRR